MARIDTHSRVVAWLKVTLPLAALAILATLFLLADKIDPEAALPYAEVDVEDRIREPRMTAPTYAGTTDDGGSLSLTASEVRPATEKANAGAKSVVAVLETPDGSRSDMMAKTAVLDKASQKMLLSGDVEITTSTGYRIVTDALSVNMDRSGLESTAPVKATGPPGNLVADKMTLSEDVRTPGAYLLVFKGGVRLIYQPGGQSAD
jgi:lipopolysaccharide export system protein LptC